MTNTALIISNNHFSSASYSAGLGAYGYHLEETRTFETARILLKSGLKPDAIIIDVKLHSNEIDSFIRDVRHQFAYQGGIIVVGLDVMVGANACLPRPALITDVVSVLQPMH